MPSSRRQISATASRLSSVSSKLGLASCARSTNSCTAAESAARGPHRGHVERRHCVLALAADAKRRPARRDDLQARAPRRAARRPTPPPAALARSGRARSASSGRRDARRSRRRAAGSAPRGHRARPRSPSRRGQDPAPATRSTKWTSRELLLQLRRRLEREARLARAAEPGQRDESRGGLLDQRDDLAQAHRRARPAASRAPAGSSRAAAAGGSSARSAVATETAAAAAAERGARGLDHLAAGREALSR